MKTCPLHDKVFNGPNSRGNYWHSLGYNKGFCNKTQEEYDALFGPNEVEMPSDNLERESVEQRDYDAENRGKVRTNLVRALVSYQGLKPLSPEDKEIVNKLTDFVMTGK